MTTDNPPKIRKSQKGLKRPQYPIELWAEIRAVYEAGKYRSLEDLLGDYRKQNKSCPSIDALYWKCAREGWIKGEFAPELKEAMHEKFMRIAREHGFDESKIVESCLEMIKDKADRNNGLQRLYDITGVRAPHKIARTDGEGNNVSEVIMLVPSNGFENT